MKTTKTFQHSISCILGLCAALVLPGIAWSAGPHEDSIREFGETRVKAWISNPIVTAALREQNARNATLSDSDIIAMDQQWRAETRSDRRPLIDRVLANELSRFLSQSKAEQRGIVTEVFVMDNRGLNVGQSDVTSDYWQGDEAKWQQTFLVGPDAVMIDEVELDESTQTFQSQLNMTITDETTGEVIGAITVGIDVEAIFWADIETASR